MDLANKIKVSLFFLAIIMSSYFAGSVKDISESKSSSDHDKKEDKSIFDNAYFSSFDLQGKSFDLNSKEIIQDHQLEKVLLKEPFGIVGESKNKILYSGKKGEVDIDHQVIFIKDDVKVSHYKGITYCNELRLFQKSDKLDLAKNIQTTQYLNDGRTLLISSEKAQIFTSNKLGRYYENVQGKVSSRKPSVNDLYFEAEEISFNASSRRLDLIDNVWLRHGKLEFWSLRGKVFLKNFSNGVKYYSLSDDVRMNDEIVIDNETLYRKAYGENVLGFVDKKEVELTGFPRVIQGDEVIRGNKILLKENTDVVEIINTNSRFNIKEN